MERVGGKWKSDGVGNEEIDDARRKDVPIDHICGAGGDHLSWGYQRVSRVVKTKRSFVSSFLLFNFV